jgi:hypothetical protein
MTRKRFSTLSDPILADPQRRERVEQHKQVILDALALAEIREARSVTQRQVAERLATSQANVSRIEHQGDLYLSTLSNYVTALGGRLEVVAVFPDQTVRLSVGDDGESA